MKVLQVMGCTSDQYASMERYLVRKADLLAQAGGALTVIYENRPRVAAFIEDFKAAGGVLLEQKMPRMTDLAYHRCIISRIRERRIDIVHTYFTPTCHAVALALRLRGFHAVVRTAANLPFTVGTAPTLSQKWRHRLFASLVARIVCRSEAVRAAYETLGVPRAKLAVADGGCDTSLYAFRPESRILLRSQFGAGPDDLVLGVCCRLVAVKRLDRLIRRVAEIPPRAPLVRLWITGDGPERPALETLANELTLGDRIRFLGHRGDLPDLYSAMDIACLPSDAEGMSNALLEAMAAQRPILASDIPPNRDVVISGQGGYLICFDNAEAFANAFASLSDPAVRARFGTFNLARVRSRFSVESRIRKELDIYGEILAGRRD